jgi:hypothetical protein
MKFEYDHHDHEEFDTDRMTDAQLAAMPRERLTAWAQAAVYAQDDATARRLGAILRRSRGAAPTPDLMRHKPREYRYDPTAFDPDMLYGGEYGDDCIDG